MTLLLRYAIRSHVGLIREGNEDSGFAGPRLLAIADGMGGAAAGEVASSVVLATMARLNDPGSDQTRPGSPASADTMHISAHDMAAMEASGGERLLDEPDLAALGGAVVTANERLRAIVAERPELEGMGTTLTAMLWSGSRFGMVHVGDSRAYRLRDGLLEQMTADHTWVQRLIDEGRITEEEAGHHPQRSLLMRAVDGRTQVEADIGTFDAYAGDRYLLCSDGLSGFVSQETLAETLAAYQDPQQAVDALIELALRAGGPDNITCIVADTLDDGLAGLAGPNEATQLLGSVTPVVVGAASEGADRLPRFTAEPPPPQDDFPQNHPAGRAARLRPRRGQQPSAMQPAEEYDPSATTMELDAVPPLREPRPNRPRSVPRQATADDAEGRGKRGFKKPLIIGGVTVLVLGGLGYGAYQWTQSKYFVGAGKDGRIVVFRGISQDFLGISLSSPTTTTGHTVYLVQLPTADQSTVKEDRSFSSSPDAQAKIEEYWSKATACYAYRHPPKQILPPAKLGSATLPGTNTNTAGAPVPGVSATDSAPPATTPPTPTAPTTEGSTGAGVSSSSGAPAPSQDMSVVCAGSQDGPSK